MELQPTNTHRIGDIIAYRCRGEWTTARVTKVNRASIRIEDGELSESNTFVPNFIKNTTNKGILQLKGRRIYKFVRPSLVSEVREVVEISNNEEEDTVVGADAETETAAVSNITLHHPKTGLTEAVRIGNYQRILASGRKAGCSGYEISEVRRTILAWRGTDRKYVKMHYSNPKSDNIKRFLKLSEKLEDFTPLLIAEEKPYTVGVGKCAMLDSKGNVVFRTATKNPTRPHCDTHCDEWKVETGIFCADRSFWKRLRSHPMFSLVPY